MANLQSTKQVYDENFEYNHILKFLLIIYCNAACIFNASQHPVACYYLPILRHISYENTNIVNKIIIVLAQTRVQEKKQIDTLPSQL